MALQKLAKVGIADAVGLVHPDAVVVVRPKVASLQGVEPSGPEAGGMGNEVVGVEMGGVDGRVV